ncbi:translation elongation factor 4 [Sphaerobacter thermophilus]|uniref:Elongation factor 4 n=1 Tax=Sphaerobacter thermophilus (strain ATCC 49802 / DSM 20745 / KCCM 41009 / NCIMB 13125 / S 6022) TaxID=479434 RepID=D1C337_SPHTD|nr:translation elongation factor 4 [Sphaerobacter thermophilus]ACZ38654.1 GTP-binding protein LepA [Sphaerobacter thermophilus DSM 20745]
MVEQERIRNFSIIAHIDHGKSTLADRLLEYTHAVTEREMVEQILDSMDLEREKGITIKARSVRMDYQAKDGITYALNLIDTPGHVDFSYEVSRSLAACEGALLVVDAAQGIEAQTMANVHLAIDAGLAIVAVVNKIDLPNAQPEKVAHDLQQVIGLLEDEIIFASAKSGLGVDEILEAIVTKIPPPSGDRTAPLRALIFDSHYDPYKGVIAYVKVVDGILREEQPLRLMATGKETDALEIGVFRPTMTRVSELGAGEVGYIATGLKVVTDCQVGDTVTDAERPAPEPLPGYRPVKPMVFAGLYPVDGEDYPALRDALARLKLNDASLVYEPESSDALGFGFRCGFLGLLHMEIIQERLEREYKLDLLATAPSVEYEVLKRDGTVVHVDNPSDMPSPGEIEEIREPWASLTIMSPSRYIGTIMELVTSRRGQFVDMTYLDEDRVQLSFEMPLAELIVDFYDQLKSRTQGYASLDYQLADMRASDLVKLDILVNGQPVDALSLITHRSSAYERGKALVESLRKLIPRQLFDVPVQASIGSRVIARETIRAMRKNVLAKCYGGDVTRKRKLLEKQKEGKARMKMVGSVEIPQEAFLAVLSLGGDANGRSPGRE